MENLFKMLAAAADGAFVINQDQTVLYWNQAAQNILGYPPSTVVGRPCYELLRGCNDKGQAVCHNQCRIMTTLQAGTAITNYDVVACTHSGGSRWINISILTTSSGPPQADTLIIHLFRDATEAHQNQQLVTQMFNAIDDYTIAGTHSAAVPDAGQPQLTRREAEVLTLLARGYSTKEIGTALSITTATVRNHIQRILNTLQVHSRLEAVIYALEHRLIAPSTPPPTQN
jgi:PAS domain S-box-containing protein